MACIVTSQQNGNRYSFKLSFCNDITLVRLLVDPHYWLTFDDFLLCFFRLVCMSIFVSKRYECVLTRVILPLIRSLIAEMPIHFFLWFAVLT